jgi:hypothetical protein
VTNLALSSIERNDYALIDDGHTVGRIRYAAGVATSRDRDYRPLVSSVIWVDPNSESVSPSLAVRLGPTRAPQIVMRRAVPASCA